jgi:hypothetical protein
MEPATVTLYVGTHHVIILPSARTSDGLALGIEPITVLPAGAPIAAALSLALDASANGTAVRPKDWRSYQPPLDQVPEYRRANRSPSRLRACLVQRDAVGTRVIPMYRLDRFNYGFLQDGQVVVAPSASLEELERAVNQALGAAPTLAAP